MKNRKKRVLIVGCIHRRQFGCGVSSLVLKIWTFFICKLSNGIRISSEYFNVEKEKIGYVQ